jgi:hypothetical protein
MIRATVFISTRIARLGHPILIGLRWFTGGVESVRPPFLTLGRPEFRLVLVQIAAATQQLNIGIGVASAGAYLCTSGFDWGLNIFDAKTVAPQWQRGAATLKMELTPAGRSLLGGRQAPLDVRYHNGPVITQASVAAVPDYEVLAYFRTETAKNHTPAGVMVDSPAIAAGSYGQGRVLLVSPHPEQTPGS